MKPEVQFPLSDKWNQVRCPFCGDAFKVPFVPTKGREPYCKKCNKKDIRKLSYVAKFAAFLREQLPESIKIRLAQLPYLGSQVLYKIPKEPERVLCVLAWRPETQFTSAPKGTIKFEVSGYDVPKQLQTQVKDIIKKFIAKNGVESPAPK